MGWQLGNFLSCRFLTGAVLLVVAAAPCRADKPATDEAVAQVADPAPQIVLWIKQLDANRFNTRERAQRQLEQVGMAALEVVAGAAAVGSLESSTRAINILLSWSESPDHDLQIASLEKLTTLVNRPREATMASELLADAHEQAALAAIIGWGGHAAAEVGLIRNGQRPLKVVIDSQWKGGTEGLAALADVRRATTVALYSVPVDDDAVEKLLGVPNLQQVQLYGTNVSDKALEKLKKNVAVVDVRSGALLGIQGSRNNGIPRVDKMVPGGAAEQAGLQAGDAITEIDGEPVTDFTALTQRIAKYQPGDSVELTIVRDGKPETKTVTFQQWSIKSTTNQNRPGKTEPPFRGNVPRQIPPPLRHNSFNRR